MTRRKRLPLFVLAVLFIASARLWASDVQQLARDLAERISALPGVTGSINITLRPNGPPSTGELAELRRLVAEELTTRRIKLSAEPGALTVALTFSEALTGRLLIAEIRTGGEAPEAIILPAPTDASTEGPLRRVSLQKSLVWQQDEPILDFEILPQQVLILSPGKVSLIEGQEQGWKERYSWNLGGIEALPRDPRGRLLLDGAEFRAYLPRHECHAGIEPGSPLACDPSSRGWPVIPKDPAETRVRLSAGRNYFDQLRTSRGLFANVPAFYAAAELTGENGPIWAVTNLDGETRFYDSRAALITRAKGWATNLASTEVPQCGSWLLAVIANGLGKESLQAFQWATDQPLAGSEQLELDAVSTALWGDEGGRVRLVTRDLKSGEYAAWSIALVCAD